jgi:hypothetical protein
MFLNVFVALAGRLVSATQFALGRNGAYKSV